MRHHAEFDVIIVGGSFAGLSAAMYLARARRSVLVLDTGAPRNRFAAAAHGFFAQDGVDPRVMIATMRSQVATYPTVMFRDDAATSVNQDADGFTVALQGGLAVTGKFLILAHGIRDILPDVPGLPERWGQSVIHCPYCHGYEFSGQRLGVLLTSPMSVHQAMLVPEWGPTTFFLNGAQIDDDMLQNLTALGVAIEPAPIKGLVGADATLSAVEFDDGRSHPLDALFVGPRYELTSDLAKQLGCKTEQGPLGASIVVDEMKATSVAGVHAAGDITRIGHTVTFACADGVAAALAVHRSLVFGTIAS